MDIEANQQPEEQQEQGQQQEEEEELADEANQANEADGLSSQDSLKGEPAKPRLKRPVSAFAVFLKEIDTEGKLTLKQRAALWNQLSSQEKQVYVQKFNKLKCDYELQVSLLGEEPQLPQSKKSVFPLQRIKAICKADPEVGNLSKQAVRLLSDLTRLFVTKLVVGAAKASERKQLSEVELGECAQRIGSLWFLRGVIGRVKKRGKKEREPGELHKGQSLLPFK